MVREEVDAAMGGPAGFGDVVGSAEAVQVRRGVAPAGHYLWRSAGVDGGSVVAEGAAADPARGVLDPPMVA